MELPISSVLHSSVGAVGYDDRLFGGIPENMIQ